MLIFEKGIISNYFQVSSRIDIFSKLFSQNWRKVSYTIFSRIFDEILEPLAEIWSYTSALPFSNFFYFSPGFYLIFENIRDFLYHRRGGGLCFVIAYAALWLVDGWVINYAMSQQTVVTSKTLCLKILWFRI